MKYYETLAGVPLTFRARRLVASSWGTALAKAKMDRQFGEVSRALGTRQQYTDEQADIIFLELTERRDKQFIIYLSRHMRGTGHRLHDK